MRKSTSLARLVTAPLALAIGVFAGSATAADVSPALKAAMKRDMALTDAQLGQYMKVQRQATLQAKALQAAQGRDFAGLWIERKGNRFHVVSATTRVAPQKGASGVEVRNVRHSLATLNAAKARLDAQRAPASVYGWSVDVRNNAVTVNVAPGAQSAGIDFVAASGADASTIRFATMGDAPRLLAKPGSGGGGLQGGSEYISSPDGSSGYYCSVGFGVTKNGAEGFATAGHCGESGWTTYVSGGRRQPATIIGSFAGSSFPGDDKAWVQLSGSNSVAPVVDGYSSADVTVRGSAVAPVGATVCRSGRTTGWHCGVVQAFNASVNYAEGTVNGMTHVKVCAEGGDSGGSFIDGGGQAQGTLSGGNYSCKGNQAQLANSYFQPIGETLQTYGLTLKTSN
jgi:streptogrisin C